MNAQHVTEEQALQKAQAFLNQKATKGGRRGAPLKMKQLENVAQNDAFYIFNAEQNGGYVIVSGDERTDEILGYSTEGNINPQTMPENMRAWLQGYEEQIKAIPTDAKAAPVKVPAHPAVEPLITAQWNQDAPYNLQCPTMIPEGSTEPLHCVTGCVATAMAQIMYYHKWPQQATTAIPAYSYGESLYYDEEAGSYIYKYNLEELPATTFNWANMKDTYTGSETDATADAVAALMRYCGQSVESEYDLTGTVGTGGKPYCCVHALPLFFGYDEGLMILESRFYTIAGWDKLIYEELYQSRPILFLGYGSSPASHAYVCDGYDGNQMYHLNWGWGGSCNGYFRLSIMNPNNNTIGEEFTGFCSYGLSSMSAIVGIQKPTGIAMTDPLGGITVSFEPQNGIFPLFVHSGQYKTVTVDIGVGLLDSNDNVTSVVTILENEEVKGLESGLFPEFFDITADMLGLSDGKYRIVPMYKGIGETEWRFGPEGCKKMFKDVVISGGVISQALSNPEISLVSMKQGDDYIDATFKNTGKTDITSKLRYLFTKDNLPDLPDNTYNLDLWTDMTDLCIEAGTTETVRLKFPGTEKGIYNYRLLLAPNYFYLTERDAQGYVISEGTVFWGCKFIDNIIGAEDVTGFVGSKITLPIVMNNTETIIGMQFDLKLPEGVSVVTDEDDDYMFTLTDRAASSHSVSADKMSDGSYRVLVSSLQNSKFKGNEGAIIETALAIANDMAAGEYPVEITNVEMTTSQNVAIRPDNFVSKLIIQDFMPGDANGDGTVSVTDVTMTISHILGQTPAGFNKDAVDINRDGSISVTDVTMIIDMILKQK